jgi:iron complex outermembrane receptor protein
VNSNIGNLNEPRRSAGQPWSSPARTNDSGNNIVNVLRDLGQDLDALHSGYDRRSRSRPGAATGKTKDWGLSGEVNYDFGAAS